MFRKAELFINLRTDPSESPPGSCYGAGFAGRAHDSNTISVFTAYRYVGNCREISAEPQLPHTPLIQQVPSKSMQIHSISSQLPDECAEPSPGSARTVFFMEEQRVQLLGQCTPCLTAHWEGKRAPNV